MHVVLDLYIFGFGFGFGFVGGFWVAMRWQERDKKRV